MTAAASIVVGRLATRNKNMVATVVVDGQLQTVKPVYGAPAVKLVVALKMIGPVVSVSVMYTTQPAVQAAVIHRQLRPLR